jgi:hypothetical protein
MENAELDRISASLGNTQSPEEVFGTLLGTQVEMLETARGIFRQMAKAVHPDVYQGTADFGKATSTFKKLVQRWEQAQTRIKNGIYGTASSTAAFEPLIIRTPKRCYSIERPLVRGDLCSLYVASYILADEKIWGILKVPIKPEDNDLVANEARILKHLCASDGYEKSRHFVSQLVDTFSYHEEATDIVRRVNVLSHVEKLYSLQEVREVYTQGIDPKDMAWIWRRLLVALGFAHASKVIHGSVLPTHILIQPKQHGVILIDWSYAVLDPAVTGEYIGAISSSYRDWYTAEVFARKEPTPGLDIAMAARCMIDLLGGDPQRTMPEAVPWQLQSYLKGCTLSNPQQRPQDAYLLLHTFDDIITRLWGPRAFRTFAMPTH